MATYYVHPDWQLLSVTVERGDRPGSVVVAGVWRSRTRPYTRRSLAWRAVDAASAGSDLLAAAVSAGLAVTVE